MSSISVLKSNEEASAATTLTTDDIDRLTRAATYLPASWPAELMEQRRAELLKVTVWGDNGPREWAEWRLLLADEAIHRQVLDQWARVGLLLDALKQTAGNGPAGQLVNRLDDAIMDLYTSSVAAALEVAPELGRVLPQTPEDVLTALNLTGPRAAEAVE